jgi:S1-C subfamily serine protease
MLSTDFVAAQTLSPQEVFRRVASSVVVVEVKETLKNGQLRMIASGSGVVVPVRVKDKTLVATNCHVVDQATDGVVTIRQGKSYGTGFVQGRDAGRDLCLVDAMIIGDSDSDGNIHPYRDERGEISFKDLPAVQTGSSHELEVGDPVYAVGAPQGLELSLSNGIVSGFREYKREKYILTTAPISKGSSGGGLFDARGRLVGITTMYVKDGQT